MQCRIMIFREAKTIGMYLLNILHRHESPSYQKNAGLSRTVKEHLYNPTFSTKHLLIQVNMTGVADDTSNKELKKASSHWRKNQKQMYENFFCCRRFNDAQRKEDQ